MNEGSEIKVISNKNVTIQKTKTVGQSKFYDVTTLTEKQDEMKPDDSEEGRY